MPLDAAAAGFEQATGGRYAEPDGGVDAPAGLAIADNWIKAWPCCLQTHGAIEAADRLDREAPEALTVTVHPVSLQAAGEGPEPADGLQAKFSIPYLTAYTLLHGPPAVESFDGVDGAAVERARSIEVRTDAALRESEFVLSGGGGEELARVRPRSGRRSSRWTPRRCARRSSGSRARSSRPRSTTRSARRPSCSRWQACPPPLWPSLRCVRSKIALGLACVAAAGGLFALGRASADRDGARDDGFAAGLPRGPRRGRARRPRRRPPGGSRPPGDGLGARRPPAPAPGGPSAPATTPAPTTSSAASTAAGRSPPRT